MTEAFKQTIETAKTLSSNERALLAHCLISSLDETQDDDVDEAWFQLAEKRWSQLESGETKAVSWEEIKRGIKK